MKRYLFLVLLLSTACGDEVRVINSGKSTFTVQSVNDRIIETRYFKSKDGYTAVLTDGRSIIEIDLPECRTGFNKKSLIGSEFEFKKSLYSNGEIEFTPLNETHSSIEDKLLIKACY